jgi:hypothetical protein
MGDSGQFHLYPRLLIEELLYPLLRVHLARVVHEGD